MANYQFKSHHLKVTLGGGTEIIDLMTLPQKRHHDQISAAADEAIPMEGTAADRDIFHLTIPTEGRTEYPNLYPYLSLTSLIVDYQYGAGSSRRKVNADAIIRLPMDRLDHLIRFAASRSIPQLQLSFDHPFPDSCNNPRIPPSLVRLSSQNLTCLILTSLCFPKLDKDSRFPFLKTLHLTFVHFIKPIHLSRLLSAPSLESLLIHRSHWLPNVTVTPRTFPNLVRFEFVNYSHFDPQNLNASLTPNLRYFYFSGAIECLHLKNCPQLRLAKIQSAGRGVLSCDRVMQLAKVFNNVNTLIVGYWFFPHYEHPLPNHKSVVLCRNRYACSLQVPLFAKLKEFHCHGILLCETSMKKLLFFICRCPLLEKLCLNFDFSEAGLLEFTKRNAISSAKDIVKDYDYEISKCTREVAFDSIMDEMEVLCGQDLHLGLKTVFVMQFPDDPIYMRMLRYILEKAPRLELLHATFVQQPEKEEEQRVAELTELKGELLGYSCALPAPLIVLAAIEALDIEQGKKCSCPSMEF